MASLSFFLISQDTVRWLCTAYCLFVYLARAWCWLAGSGWARAWWRWSCSGLDVTYIGVCWTGSTVHTQCMYCTVWRVGLREGSVKHEACNHTTARTQLNRVRQKNKRNKKTLKNQARPKSKTFLNLKIMLILKRKTYIIIVRNVAFIWYQFLFD